MPLFDGDLILVQWFGKCFGQRIILDQWYRWTGTADPGVPTSASLDDILTKIGIGGPADITTAYLACLPNNYSLEFTRGQVIEPVRSAYRAYGDDAGPGTFPTPTLTSNNTGVITLRTENAGRDQISNRHIGPLPTLAETGGFLTVAYGDLLRTLASRLASTFPTTVPVGELSAIIRHKDRTPRYDAITNAVIGPTVRTQRRRTVGLGE